MDFWSLYAFIMIVQLCRKRFNSSKALATGFVIGLAHSLIFSYVDFNSEPPIMFYSVMFLLSFGWFCILDMLNLKLSAIFSGFLVAFQIVMVFNSLGDSVTDTMLYAMYPYVIIVVNSLMIGAAFGERDGLDYNRSHSHSGNKSGNAHEDSAR